MSKIQGKDDVRYIENPFHKVFSIIKPDNDKLYSMLFTLLTQFFGNVKVPCLLAIASDPKETEARQEAYDGASGYTYTLIRLARFFKLQEPKNVEKASQIFQGDDLKKTQYMDWEFYLNKALEQNRAVTEFILGKPRQKTSVSFYMSEVCTWVCGMHLGYLTRNAPMFRENQMRIRECFERVKQYSDKMQYEVLYGVPGYLYAILEVKDHYDNVQEQLFKTNFEPMAIDLTHLIIKKGVTGFQQISKKKIDINNLPEDFRLLYTFHKKQYLGGAHGLGGNLNILLMSMRMNKFGQNLNRMYPLIKKSVQFLITHLINGNFATSAGGTRTKLVHFCHGCPGVVYCLARFAEIFPQDGIKMGIKDIIEANLDHIWKYGVLKKGFGLCHGISGNAYAFLSPSIHSILPQRAEQYKRKAIFFGVLREEKGVMKQIRQYHFQDRLVVGVSDSPYSLMLGVAGDICFTIDALNGVGRFPGFDF